MKPDSTACWYLFGCALLLAIAEPGRVWSAGHLVSWQLHDTKGKPLEDAVVSLHPLDGASPPALASADGPAAEIHQQDRIFVPYVTVIRVGESVIFPNRDSVQHHIYSLAKSKRFEIPLHGRDEPKVIAFEQPGVVPLGCNIHDWMQCYVVVLPTSYFAKTGADGVAAIADPPPGRYRTEIWHPRLAQVVTGELEVTAGAAPPVQSPSLKLRPDRRVRKAPARSLRDYP